MTTVVDASAFDTLTDGNAKTLFDAFMGVTDNDLQKLYVIFDGVDMTEAGFADKVLTFLKFASSKEMRTISAFVLEEDLTSRTSSIKGNHCAPHMPCLPTYCEGGSLIVGGR
jgi:hypothetical protein